MIGPPLVMAVAGTVMVSSGDVVQVSHNRPLDLCYPIVWVDALVVKIRTDGVVRNRPAHLVLGLHVEGRKEALGLWIGRGGESAKFWLSVDTGLQVYFCDPKSANPMTNATHLHRIPDRPAGHQRKHQRTVTPIFSKGTDMSRLTQNDLDQAAYLLNTRPRQTLDGMTPSDKLAETMQ